jgi:hypothetical protein
MYLHFNFLIADMGTTFGSNVPFFYPRSCLSSYNLFASIYCRECHTVFGQTEALETLANVD